MSTLVVISLLLSRFPGAGVVVSAEVREGAWVLITPGAEITIRPKFARVFVSGVEVPNRVTNGWDGPIGYKQAMP